MSDVEANAGQENEFRKWAEQKEEAERKDDDVFSSVFCNCWQNGHIFLPVFDTTTSLNYVAFGQAAANETY